MFRKFGKCLFGSLNAKLAELYLRTTTVHSELAVSLSQWVCYSQS